MAFAAGGLERLPELNEFTGCLIDMVFEEAGLSRPAEGVVCAFKGPVASRKYEMPLQPLGHLPVTVYGFPNTDDSLTEKAKFEHRLRIAYVQGPMDGLERLTGYTAHNNIALEAMPFVTYESAWEALRRKTVDGVLMPTDKPPEGYAPVIELGLTPYYMAVEKGYSPFAELEAAWDRLKVFKQDRIDACRSRILRKSPSPNRVRVVLPFRPCLVEEDEFGLLRGSVIEWLERVFVRNEFVLDSVRTRSYAKAKEYVGGGQVDLIAVLPLEPDNGLLYPHLCEGYMRNYLIVRRDSRFASRDPSAWHGAKVAVLESTRSSESLISAFLTRGVSLAVQPCSSEEEVWETVASGRADLLMTTNAQIPPDYKIVYALPPLPCYFAFAPDRIELHRQIGEAIEHVLRVEPFLSRKIDAIYAPTPEGFECALDLADRDIARRVAALRTPIHLSFSGISFLPDGIRGLDNINRIFAKVLSERIYRDIGVDVILDISAPEIGSASDFVWRLNRLWKFGVARRSDVVRVELEPLGAEISAVSKEEIVLLLFKVCNSISDLDMQRMIYEAVSLGQERPLLSRAGFVFCAALVLIVMCLMCYADLRIRRERNRAEAALAAKTRFLATISHEIRTPLNAIVGFGEHLNSTTNSEDNRRECTEGIRKSSTILQALINDVLDLTKLETTRENLRLGECDLGVLLEECQTIFGERAQNKGLTFQIEAPDNPPTLEVYTPSIRQILLNLLGNAVKYTDEGRVVLSCGLVPNGDGLVDLDLTIADTGCGISDEAQPTIFDPFTRDIAGHGGRIYEGTGLGLPIVRRLVALLGGTIGLESQLHKGTTFRIHLPKLAIVDTPHVAQPADTVAKPMAVPREALARLNVVAVDDVQMNLKVLKIHLNKAGVHEVRFFDNPETALQDLRRAPADVLLTDIWMPGMNGEELARACRKLKDLQSMRIVAVSADADAEQTFDLSIFDETLTKPVTFAGVCAVLEKSL